MQKTIWEKYAEVLVDYSTNVQKGDLVVIRAESMYAKELEEILLSEHLLAIWQNYLLITHQKNS